MFSSYRLIGEKKIGNDIATYSKRLYRFTFMFYNNDKTIKLYKFVFDDNMDVELEESLKLYLH